MTRDLKRLTPKAQELHARFAFEMARAGLLYVVTSTLRTIQEQEALYAQGRVSHEEVNRLRKLAGLSPIGQKEASKIVTWTLKSRHLSGRAFDIALIGIDGKPHWNDKISVNVNQVPDYLEAGIIGESVGLIWGGRWATPDYPHFEAPA